VIAGAGERGYHDQVAGSSIALALALLLAWKLEGPTTANRGEEIPRATPVVVTTVAPLDAPRLADALHAYLNDAVVQVVPLPPGKTDDVRQRLRQQVDDARQVGQAAGATTVIRVERDESEGGTGDFEIALVDLTNDEVVIASIAPPARDEDRYRALALKIQAVLRAHISAAVARAGHSGGSSPDASGADVLATARRSESSALGLDVGLALVAFPIAGPLLEGVEGRGRWLPSERTALTIGAALLGSASASSGGVSAVATMVPLRATAALRLGTGRAALFAGPCAELSFLRIAATSADTPVRSVRHLTVALGAEADARLALTGPLSLFARVAALGVLNGESYEAAGVPLIDTSRFELGATAGVAAAIP